MVIQCLIQRDGPTHMNLNGFSYTFKENEHGHYVAEVNSREHREYLLSLPDFKAYEAPIEDNKGEVNADGIAAHRRRLKNRAG